MYSLSIIHIKEELDNLEKGKHINSVDCYTFEGVENIISVAHSSRGKEEVVLVTCNEIQIFDLTSKKTTHSISASLISSSFVNCKCIRFRSTLYLLLSDFIWLVNLKGIFFFFCTKNDKIK